MITDHDSEPLQNRVISFDEAAEMQAPVLKGQLPCRLLATSRAFQDPYWRNIPA